MIKIFVKFFKYFLEYFKGSNISEDANKFFLTKLESIISQNQPEKKTNSEEKNEKLFTDENDKSEIIHKIEKKYNIAKINQLENSYSSNDSRNSNNSLSLSDESESKITKNHNPHPIHDPNKKSKRLENKKPHLNLILPNHETEINEINDTISDMNNSLFTESYRHQRDGNNSTSGNLSEIISIDKQTLNFGICFPGEITKRKFKLKNNSYSEKYQLEIKFNFGKDSNFTKYFSKFFIEENINSNTKNIKKFPEFENAMLKYNCYSLPSRPQDYKDHIDKDNKDHEPLSERKIQLKGCEEREIEVCFTTPFNKSKENLYTVIHVISHNQVIHTVPIISTLEIPKLLCLKDLSDLSSQNAKFPLISLMLEIKSKGQKFKLPFKNASLKDMQIEFSIDTKVSKSLSIFVFEESYYECQFVIFPSLLDIPSQSTGYIDLLAKIRRIKNDENLNLEKLKEKINDSNRKIRKIIIGKLMGASVVYNFFVEAQVRGVQN